MSSSSSPICRTTYWDSRPGTLSGSIKTPPASVGSSIRPPDTDEEFGLNSHEFSYGEAIPGGAASGRMDLLTVLAHEPGHLLGFEHDTEPGHLMSETLASGVRLLPPISDTAIIDDVFATPDWP